MLWNRTTLPKLWRATITLDIQQSFDCYLNVWSRTNLPKLKRATTTLLFKFWCRMSDSNRPPSAYKTLALPDELIRLKKLVSG